VRGLGLGVRLADEWRRGSISTLGLKVSKTSGVGKPAGSDVAIAIEHSKRFEIKFLMASGNRQSDPGARFGRSVAFCSPIVEASSARAKAN